MVKIGLIRETKTPVDNRVALTPSQARDLMAQYPGLKIVAQSSNLRAYTDNDYRALGIEVTDDVSDCDVLFGVKEPRIDTLIRGKHYFFFGHIAKGQEYNKPLKVAMLNQEITFTDYEYLVDRQGKRVVAFGWWAGVVGVYNTLRLYGLRYNAYSLPKPDSTFTLKALKSNLDAVKKQIDKLAPKILVTGAGRVASGAIYILNHMGICRVGKNTYLLNENFDRTVYCQANTSDLVADITDESYHHAYFHKHPEDFFSTFAPFAYQTDILISCHYWGMGAPVYMTPELAASPDNRIRVIGDVTCDIKGSIQTTIRSSTHDEPFYDICPDSLTETGLFSSVDNISVMAVDTCPNALPLDASADFGRQLIEAGIFENLALGQQSHTMETATIIGNGRLTPKYSYLGN